MQAINNSPFVAENFVNIGRDGGEQLVLVSKATFALPQDGSTRVSMAPQRSIQHADECSGEAGSSSVLYEADFGMVKLGTDVALVGHAVPARQGVGCVDVSVQVGKIGKVVRVFGDRVWQRGIGAAKISAPHAFEKMPLTYERAFGGADNSHSDPNCHEFDPWNPVGVGFRARKSAAPIDGAPLPNLEDPDALIRTPADRPRPCGVGFVGAHWKPRQDYQGTYDDAWLRDQMPLPPSDFDDRFHSSGALGLTSAQHFVGGEPVVVKGTGGTGRCAFHLPRVHATSSICIGATVTEFPLSMNTVVIDTDAQELVMVWRGSFSINKCAEDVRWTHFETTAPIEFVCES